MLKTLSELHKGDRAIIAEVGGPEAHRLMEMGFLKGEALEVLHEGPIGKDPMAIKVRGGTLALRRAEARWIRLTGEEQS